MGGTEREVAFRKRRRDYTVSGRKNPIRDGTITIKVQQEKFIRPETLLSRSRQAKADQKKSAVNSRRKPSVNFPQPTEDDKFCLVIRTCPATSPISKANNETLAKIRLTEQFDAVFLALNEETRVLLKSISHLITFGVPSPETISQLIHTRGAVILNGEESLIKSNKEVSSAFGTAGIESINEIVDILSTFSSNFELVASGLAPFHLNKKNIKFPKLLSANGGEGGWRGENIDEFVQAIL